MDNRCLEGHTQVKYHQKQPAAKEHNNKKRKKGGERKTTETFPGMKSSTEEFRKAVNVNFYERPGHDVLLIC